MARHPTLACDKSYRVTHLWELHKEMLRMLVLGFKPKEICSMYGVSEGFLSNLRNSPLARAYIEPLEVARDAATAEVSRELVQTAPKAAKLLKDVITGNESASLRLKVQAAQDWLSRSGFPRVQKSESVGKVGIDDDTLSVLKERANAAREEAKRNEVIAEFEEETA